MADYTNGVYLDIIAMTGDGPVGFYLLHPNVGIPLTEMDGRFPSGTSIGLDSGTPGVQLYYPSYGSPTDTVIFSSQELPVDCDIIPKQQLLFSGANEPSIYDSAETDKIFILHIANVDETKRVRLYKFLVNIVQFAKNEFDIMDESGDLYRVRFIDKGFPSSMYAWLKYNFDLHFWVVSITEA